MLQVGGVEVGEEKERDDVVYKSGKQEGMCDIIRCCYNLRGVRDK